MTRNKNGNPRKKGSGRTKGAVSFVEVTLGELNRILKQDAVIMVSRKYAEALNLDSKAVEATASVVEAAANTINIKTSDLTKDEGHVQIDW